MINKKGFSIACAAFVCFGLYTKASGEISFDTLDKYNVRWNALGTSSADSMPLGNGDVGLNVWTEQNGDLVFYIGKNDAWSDQVEGAVGLIKVGRVRVSLNPNPFAGGQDVSQELVLRDGSIVLRANDSNKPSQLRIWVDANRPVIHVEAECAKPVKMRVAMESWRKVKTDALNTDTILNDQTNRIVWYYRNQNRDNPHLLNRTIGAGVKGEGLVSIDAETLESPLQTKHHVAIHTLTSQPPTTEEWLAQLDRQIATTLSVPIDQAWREHQKWWEQFWNRSWIFATTVRSEKEPNISGIIPSNKLNFRVGIDSSGGNQFVGKLGRASLLKRALSEEEIRVLASNRESMDAEDKDILYSAIPELYTELADSAEWTDLPELTAEMWVNPTFGSGDMRILDKVIPGDNNGVLLDTNPEDSLRLIIGGNLYSAPHCLKSGQWHHVAVVVDSGKGRIELYLDGKRIAGKPGTDEVDEASAVTEGYLLQRFKQACSSRGEFPIKFNGSIFTVDGPNPWAPKGTDPNDKGKWITADFRCWGGMYWFQNTRAMYWPMLASGDFDLMLPLFRMYRAQLDGNLKQVREFYGHGGAYVRETAPFWGGLVKITAEDPGDYTRHYYTPILELSAMMLDYYAYTRDEEFARQTLLPMAEAGVTFYAEHFPREPNGTLRIEPSNSIETYWKVRDPLPDIAGLTHVLQRLIALPPSLATEEQQKRWQTLLSQLPAVPIGIRNGAKQILPFSEGQESKVSNSENPELYAIYPFRLYGIGKPELEVGQASFAARRVKSSGCWSQDAVQAALLGDVKSARKDVFKHLTNKDPRSRFPAIWVGGFDYVPDEDNGGNGLNALQLMLMQCDGDAIHLLPAWPDDWNADFKLHAPMQTTVEGRVEGGKIVDLKVTPESRKKDVKIGRRK